MKSDEINRKAYFEAVEKMLVTALNNDVFSGASLLTSKWTEKGWERLPFYCGKSSFLIDAEPVNERSFFDIASLTKPIVTVSSLFHLNSIGKIDIEQKVKDIFEKTEEKEVGQIKICQLLSHCSGLAAHRPYYELLKDVEKGERKSKLKHKIFNEKIEYKPGTKHIYSDLGYILLGYIIEHITKKSIDAYWRENVALPFGLTDELHFPGIEKDDALNYVKTGVCPWNKNNLKGIVHDDNCRSAGGICGHAGLFGTAIGVGMFCEKILSIFHEREHIPEFSGKHLKKWIQRIERSNWCLGFDMVSSVGSSSGKFFSKESIGHLGFTGTSMWIDIQKNIVIVFLTNRVLQDADNRKIKRLRPELHDSIMKILIN